MCVEFILSLPLFFITLVPMNTGERIAARSTLLLRRTAAMVSGFVSRWVPLRLLAYPRSTPLEKLRMNAVTCWRRVGGEDERGRRGEEKRRRINGMRAANTRSRNLLDKTHQSYSVLLRQSIFGPKCYPHMAPREPRPACCSPWGAACCGRAPKRLGRCSAPHGGPAFGTSRLGTVAVGVALGVALAVATSGKGGICGDAWWFCYFCLFSFFWFLR